MAKPDREAQFTTDLSTSNTGATASLPSYAWWLVLGLVGLDCFSTLAYLPTIAVDGADLMAPLAAVAVSLVLLFVALPIYLYVVGRSPNGRGATGLLESRVSGWGGKLLILLLLGFVATDFVMTRTVSLATAAKHLTESRHVNSAIHELLVQMDNLHENFPDKLKGETTDSFFAWWNEQLIVTVFLTILGFAFYFFLLRGFTRSFLYAATVIVGLFLLLNALVLGSGLLYLARNPEYLNNWMDLVHFGTADPLDLVYIAIQNLPYLALGLSGFELTMTSVPLVRGRSDDDPSRPRGRIRNARILLLATAVLMSLLVPASVFTVKFLVPGGKLRENGEARYRALAYLAHGGALQPAGQRVSTGKISSTNLDAPEEPDDAAPARPVEGKEPAADTHVVHATGADLNPLFGPAFGTLYEISTILILCLAGASVTLSLRDLLPQYLTRYGMEMRWAHRIGVLLHLFNVIVLVVVIVFRASVTQQQGAYATSVLVLLFAAALAVLIDVRTRWRRSLLGALTFLPLIIACGIFALMAYQAGSGNPAGILIALAFVAVVFVMAGLSRWMRSTELRYDGFTFADEETGVRWEQIRRMEFQVLVPYRRGESTLAETETAIRAHHRLGADVPIIFIETELGDPSDFQHHPLMQIIRENGAEVIRVSQCASIAHVLAAIALEFREVGRPPEMHFSWSEEAPLASNLNFLLWGQGNVPWMVHALIRKSEPDLPRQPRVVIG